MKTHLTLGLIIAFFLSALSVSVWAKAPESIASKSKKHHVKKHQTKKGIRSTRRKAKTKRAQVSKSMMRKKSVSDDNAKLQTDINFNDSILRGRYQTPDEATVKVENEKALDDLLTVRTDFKDRLKKASEQN